MCVCVLNLVFVLVLSDSNCLLKIHKNFKSIQRVSCYSSVIRLQFTYKVLLLLFHNKKFIQQSKFPFFGFPEKKTASHISQ